MNSLKNNLPLFVPSFSSKGNLFFPKGDGKFVSDNYELPEILNIRLSETYLVSAYDIYYGFMPQDPEMWPETRYLFIDSGGYETNDSFDLSERNKYNYHVLPWDEEKMKEVYRRVLTCSKFTNTTIILSGFDSCAGINDQLNRFADLQQEFPTAVINQLIKLTDRMDDVARILINSHKLSDIQILGFTEKELGHTLKERLIHVMLIKHELNNAGWNGLIHVFGGLEPSLSRLYFIAGADIFDGLSWQRTRYKGNATLYEPHNYFASSTEEENKLWMMIDNLSELRSIKDDLGILLDYRAQLSEQLGEKLKDNNVTVFDLLSVLEG